MRDAWRRLRADAEAWISRLSPRERVMVAAATAAVLLFTVFLTGTGISRAIAVREERTFDKYNSQAKANPPAYGDPADVVGAAKAQSVRFGKPFAFWETGTNNFGEQAKRVAWAKALKAELIKQKANCAIWFDRPSTSGSGWDATLDRPTAEAWLL